MVRPRLFSFLTPPIQKRRRIVLLFVLGIALPSVLLAGLAFRGVQNDRALLQEERLKDSREVAGQVIREVDAKIGAVEAAFATAAANAVRDPTPTDSPLKDFVAEQPLVEDIFLLEQRGVVECPVARFLYLPDDSGPSESLSRPAYIQNAQRLEFRDKDYPKALAAYRRALNRAVDARSEAEIWSAVARVQKKAGLLAEAAESYEKLARDYSKAAISEGIPVGPAARLELASVLKDMGDTPGSLSALRDLYRSLVRSEWPLRKSQFNFFSGRVKEAFKGLFAQPLSGLDVDAFKEDFERLEEVEKRKREETEKAIAFQKGAAEALEAKLGDVGEPGRKALRLNLGIRGYSYLVSIPGQRPEDSKGTWGLILDAVKLREEVLRPALLRHVSSSDIAWVVEDREGGAIMASDSTLSWPLAVRTAFVSNFPDWRLALYQKPPDLLGSFLGSRRGVYAYMFLLIAGILVFGLVLTIRTVSHELELARMKSKLVSTISHEFKSPLAAIRQLAEMLHAGRVPSEERRRKYYDILLEQSERLSLLTDNVLNLARIEEGRKEYRLKTSDLNTLLREVVSSFRERVAHEGYELDFSGDEGEVVTDVDTEAFSQVFANLLDNAVKYSGESRRVVVRLSVEDRQVVVTVRDFGVGIRKEEHNKVFERFYRCGDELTRTVRGTGLGLSLVKEIVEAHGGRVGVDSELGKGSAFFIRLPLSRTKEGRRWRRS